MIIDLTTDQKQLLVDILSEACYSKKGEDLSALMELIMKISQSFFDESMGLLQNIPISASHCCMEAPARPDTESSGTAHRDSEPRSGS